MKPEDRRPESASGQKLMDIPNHRHIRSFVRRQGRMTPSQTRALDKLWPRFGIEPSETRIDFEAVFGRNAPVTLEIGFGNGESLAAMAATAPERDFLGIEVHRPGVGHLLLAIERQQLTNLRVMCADATEVLERQIRDNSLDRVQLFFPDPWQKKRHHKRRILQLPFIALIHNKLQPGGLLHMATDWRDYAQHMLSEMEARPGFTNLAGKGQFSPRPEWRPLTKFERRGQRLGHGIWDLLYRKDLSKAGE